MWIIKDWAGNVLDFKGRVILPQFAVAMEFKTFDDGEEYLSEVLGSDYEEIRGEYYIEENTCNHIN